MNQPPDAGVPAPLSRRELTTEEVRAANALFEVMGNVGLVGRARQAVEAAAHHLAACALAAGRAERQARAADPREGGLREAIAAVRRSVRFVERQTGEDLRSDEMYAMLRLAATPARAAAPAPDDLPARVVVGANGAYWRDYGDAYSMCPVSDDNDPVEVVAVYERRIAAPAELAESIDAVADALNGWDQGEAPRPDTYRHWARIVDALTGAAAEPAGLPLDALAWAVHQTRWWEHGGSTSDKGWSSAQLAERIAAALASPATATLRVGTSQGTPEEAE